MNVTNKNSKNRNSNSNEDLTFLLVTFIYKNINKLKHITIKSK